MTAFDPKRTLVHSRENRGLHRLESKPNVVTQHPRQDYLALGLSQDWRVSEISEMQRRYQDSTKLMARAMLHIKCGPPGNAWSLADTGLIRAGARVGTVKLSGSGLSFAKEPSNNLLNQFARVSRSRDDAFKTWQMATAAA